MKDRLADSIVELYRFLVHRRLSRAECGVIAPSGNLSLRIITHSLPLTSPLTLPFCRYACYPHYHHHYLGLLQLSSAPSKFPNPPIRQTDSFFAAYNAYLNLYGRDGHIKEGSEGKEVEVDGKTEERRDFCTPDIASGQVEVEMDGRRAADVTR